jgi:hypothetical protein
VITATDSAFIITGIVRNAATLQGLPDAMVWVDGDERRVATDSAGLFRLDLSRTRALPTRLSVIAPGFEPHLHAISMSANAGLRLEIFMTHHQICLESVTPGG